MSFAFCQHLWKAQFKNCHCPLNYPTVRQGPSVACPLYLRQQGNPLKRRVPPSPGSQCPLPRAGQIDRSLFGWQQAWPTGSLCNTQNLKFKDSWRANWFSCCKPLWSRETPSSLLAAEQAPTSLGFQMSVFATLSYFFLSLSFSLFRFWTTQTFLNSLNKDLPSSRPPAQRVTYLLPQSFFSHANPGAHLHKVSVVTISFRWADFYAACPRRCPGPGPPWSWS